MSDIQKVDTDSRKQLLAEQFDQIEAEAPEPAPAAEPAGGTRPSPRR